MLTSLALILLCGLLFGKLFSLLRLPGLVGMLFVGIVFGPHALNLLDASILSMSPHFSQIAMVIILTRVGLSIDLRDLRKVGRPAVLLCFVPACFEMAAATLLAPPLLGISLSEAAVLGAVITSVSPAVVIPGMLKLMERGYGKDKRVPQLIMAGASLDGVFVIVMFSAFLSLAGGGEFSATGLLGIPVSIGTGAAAGLLLGYGLSAFFKRFHMRDSVKVMILLGVSFLLLAIEKELDTGIPFSGLLAVMCLGGGVLKWHEALAERLAAKYSKLWVAAEVVLFVLVGATVDARYAASAGGAVILVILLALAFRMLGVFVSTAGTALSGGERLFCMIAYVPKATVQAAIGGIPLAMGLPCGPIVLTAAVLAILITAPLGALGIDLTYAALLSRDETSRASR